MESLLLAYSLSGAAGLRSALSMLVVSIAVTVGFLHPNPSMMWLGSGWLIMLAFAATLVEFFGDKIPAVDHALHTVHFLLTPIAGAIVAMSGYQGDPAVDVVLALVGGGNALFVHSTRSAVRVVSSATTVGLANPLISLVEDCLAAVFILIAIFLPWLTALVLVLLTVWLVKMIKRLRASRQTA